MEAALKKVQESIEAYLQHNAIEEKPDNEEILLPIAPNSDPDNRCVNSG